MIDEIKFIGNLQKYGIEFFTGVPDSYLNEFCNALIRLIPNGRHVIAANEGNAIGIAAGYYLATGKIPLVYMQNSGTGNAMNPLLSLTDKNVYSIPMILLIGWRGEPGKGDHPQHERQGKIMLDFCELCDIPYLIVEEELIDAQLEQAVKMTHEMRKPVALIGKKGIFSSGKKKELQSTDYPLSREQAMEIVLNTLPKNAIYVATTGRATRELYYLREKRKDEHKFDFLNIGAMGHASSVALGIALTQKNRMIVCFDGDASAIMHMGSFSTACKVNVCNFLHIVLNNGVHESVGGQPSAGKVIDFTKIAEGSGYRTPLQSVQTQFELEKSLNDYLINKGPYFIEIKIHKGSDYEIPALHVSYQMLIQDLQNELRQ